MIQSMKLIQENKDKKDTAKMILGLVFGIAADAAVTAALGGLMPAGGGWKRLFRMGGTFVLAMMAGEKVEEYVYRVFDETEQALKDARKELDDIPEKAEGSVK